MINNKKIGKNSSNMILFFLIFFILILGIIFSELKINIENITYSKIEKNVDIIIILMIFRVIPLKLVIINNNKIQALKSNTKIKKITENVIDKFNITKVRKNIKFHDLCKLKIRVEKIKLYLEYSTRDVLITAFLTPIISTIISYIYSYSIDKYNKKNFIYKITPTYIKKQYIYINFESIIKIRMWNIINIILLIRRKMK